MIYLKTNAHFGVQQKILAKDYSELNSFRNSQSRDNTEITLK